MDLSSSKRAIGSNNTTAVKPQVYNFDIKNNSIRILYKNSESQYSGNNEQTAASNQQQINWKPKIPTKKLFQQPKFLLSLERKKVRVINGLIQSQLSLAEINSKNFKGDRVKAKRQLSRPRRKQNDQKADYYIHNNLSLQKTQKYPRIPITNFNLHHLIRKRKTYQSQMGSGKQGSNNPYYEYVSSSRFQRNKSTIRRNSQLQLFTRACHSRKRSEGNPNPNPNPHSNNSRTVQLKIQRQNEQIAF